jgi:hypothetical protein
MPINTLSTGQFEYPMAPPPSPNGDKLRPWYFQRLGEVDHRGESISQKIDPGGEYDITCSICNVKYYQRKSDTESKKTSP